MPVDPENPAPNRWYRFTAWLAFAVLRLQRWSVEIRGAQHLPRVGGAVIVANHTSFWDFLTVGFRPYLSWGRPLRILAKESLFTVPMLGFLMRRCGHIPVTRGNAGDALGAAIEALRAGELVLVLPEQTITPSFELLPFKKGAARMAAEAGVPLVPAASWGSHRFHTVGRGPRWSWRLPVTVLYDAPMLPTPSDDLEVVMAELEQRVGALLDEAQRTYRDGCPTGAWWVPARLGGGAPTPREAEAFLATLAERWGRQRQRRPRRRGCRR